MFLSEELRILNNRLELTESHLRQAQAELEKQELKNQDTKRPSITVPTPAPIESFPVTNTTNTTTTTAATTSNTTSTAFNVSK